MDLPAEIVSRLPYIHWTAFGVQLPSQGNIVVLYSAQFNMRIV